MEEYSNFTTKIVTWSAALGSIFLNSKMENVLFLSGNYFKESAIGEKILMNYVEKAIVILNYIENWMFFYSLWTQLEKEI